MSARSLLEDSRQIVKAIRMIELGARLQMLQSETNLPYERLLKLYKEVAGKSPSKGQLPFSTDWFMTWQPNIHASLFYNIHTYLMKSAPIDDSDAIVKAYELYTAEVKNLIASCVRQEKTVFKRSAFDKLATSKRWGKPLAVGIIMLGLILSMLIGFPFMGFFAVVMGGSENR